MSEPVRNAFDPHATEPVGAGQGHRVRPLAEDPLAELARILGEGGAHPVRPEHVVEVGRRTLPKSPAPAQVSDLEAELFESLRSSVTPEERVRGDFVREVPKIIPQHPVDDHDIASLSGFSGAEAAEDPIVSRSVDPASVDPRWADFYAYDDGVTAGSYDPAFDPGPAQPLDLDAAFAAEIHRARGGEGPRPTFDEFDTAAIARAAAEASPYVADEAVILPHSMAEEFEARQLPHETGRSGFKVAIAVVGVLLAGGAALAGWKILGDPKARGPVLVQADGKPLKVLPDPNKAPTPGEGEISMKRDTKVDGSKIVSLQEDPVAHVAGRTPEGREVRVINPGTQRAASPDQPHTVKTVVVRPDGSIVSEGGAQVRGPTVGTPSAPAEKTAAAEVPPVPSVPLPNIPVTTTRITTQPVVPTLPQAAAVPQTVPMVPLASAPAETAPAGRAVDVPMPIPAPTRPVASAPPSPPAETAPVPVAPAPVKIVTTTPITPPKPIAPPKPVAPKPVAVTPQAPAGAPMALGPVAPRLASSQPAAPAPVRTPAAPVASAPTPITPAASGGGEWMVQISASKSDADARRSFSDAQRRFSALSGRAVDVQRADLGAKGTYYRARVSAGSREAAASLCSQIQSQGGQCMVTRR